MYQGINKKRPSLSVIIPTRNRPKHLFNCLKKLSCSSFVNYEVIIIDQSDNIIDNSKLEILSKEFYSFKFVKSDKKGRSKGMNQGLKLAKSSYIVFLDDDCIPDKKWLYWIYYTFKQNPSVFGVSGRVVPYQPKKHQGFFCPSIFENKNSNPHIIDKPGKHWEEIGLGNNMAFRKKVFNDLGGFKEWLGVGSIGKSAEDAEIALRMLIAGKKIFYNPKSLIYHNSWYSAHEIKLKNLSYIYGEIACYLYVALKYKCLAGGVLINNLREVFVVDPKNIISNFVRFKKYTFSLIFWFIANNISRFLGGMIAIIFYITEKFFNYPKDVRI